jgi:hypothetical protein
MARYRIVQQKVYLRPEGEANIRICRPGEEISYSGPPSRCMVPLDEAAELAARRAGGAWFNGSLAASFAQHRRDDGDRTGSE